ncbi:MAG: PAS domain S-box protein [Acetivibrionales bacterium]
MEKEIRVLFATKTEEYMSRLAEYIRAAGYKTLNTYVNADRFLLSADFTYDYDVIILDCTGFDPTSNETNRIASLLKKNAGIPFVLILESNAHFEFSDDAGFTCFEIIPASDISILKYIIKRLLSEACLYKKLLAAREESGKEIERLITTLASIGDGVITTDIEGRITFMNRVAGDLTGWDHREARGQSIDTVFKIIDKNTNTPMESPFLTTIETGEKSGLKRSTVLVSKDGNEYYVSASSSPIRDNQGIITGLVAVFRDITRHRNLEDNLIKSKDYYLTLFESFPALIWRADINKKFNYFNKMWLDFTGRTLEQESGSGWVEGVYPEDAQQMLKVFNDAFDERRSFETEYRLKNRNGQYRWILNIGRPFFDLENQFSGFIGACFDITERKIAEEGLSRYQLLSQKANDIILFADINGFVIEANDAAVHAFGYQKEQLLGRSIFYLINPDPSLPIGAPSYHTDAGGIYYEASAYRNDGSTFTAEVSMQATEIGNSKVLMAILRDTTERKRINEELKKAKESAEAANRAKSEFLANMSHEIRTPLNGMTGMIDLTLLTDLTEVQRDNLLTAKECALTLLNLINDILDFSKIEAGKLTIEDINFNMEELVGQAVKPHILKANEKGLQFSCELDDNIPETLIGDPYRLKQVINNLLSNAIKFTDSGEVKLEARIISGNDDYVTAEFKVSDTGIGIKNEDMKKLFISFTQVDSSHTRKYGGTGLGLSISKQLVEKMGGSIWVESIKGKGSTFYFTIKLGVGKSAEDAPDDALQADNTREPLEILLAEDDKVNQIVIGRMVNEAGHKITVADNGKEALEALNSRKFDVILMDIQMPEMDGIETTRRIREKEAGTNRHIPIIAVTAYALKGDKERLLSLGMDAYISKPIRMDALLKTIKTVVEKPTMQEYRKNGSGAGESDTSDQYDTGSFLLEYARRAGPVLLEINENINRLEYFYKRRDQAEIEKYAHKIKKLSAEISIPLLKSTIFKAELAARRGDITESFKYFSKARKELSDYMNEIDLKKNKCEGRMYHEDTYSGG